MAVLWVVLFLASSGIYTVNGLPIGPTPQTYPHDPNGHISWDTGGWMYAFPALALVITAVGLLFGCTWCYRHKDCKLFTASATHLHDGRRSQPPDSGFSEPVNNNISEDNNNGPISLREMQNIANNNAAAYITSENEERNRVRDSVVEFEPLPSGIRVVDPLERCADWFGGEDFPRSQLQYLREIGNGWFGRVVEAEIEDGPSSTTVAVKILNHEASLEDKARFLDEARVYRDISHENVLPFVAKCLAEDPWMLIFELCSMDLQQYLEVNRPKMAILNESGVPLQLMCDVSAGLAHLHSRGYLYGPVWSGGILVRVAGAGAAGGTRALLGRYCAPPPAHACCPPESLHRPPEHTASTEVWWLGCVVWEVCAWGAPPPRDPPPPPLPCPYRTHLYQVMQLCWNPVAENRPTAAQVHALLNHLHTTHSHTGADDTHFEERWQTLKPNTIPKVDEHVAIVHAPSTSTDSQFGSDLEFESAPIIQDSLSVGDTAVSRSSSIMSDKEPLSVQMKSESLTNLHGSFEDVRNIYLTHNEAAALECHQGNISLDEKEQDRSDSSVDPWLKDIITGSQDDVSYFKDVSDVIKNLDNILNSEKTSSSESSHQASPSRDNLSLECKKEYPMQTSLVKSPGIRNFQNILEMGFDSKSEENVCDDDADRETIGTLSHSFERHSDNTSQYTLENLTPETPIADFASNFNEPINVTNESMPHSDLPNDNKLEASDNVPKLKELCEATIPRISNEVNEQDCTQHDSELLRTENTETKSLEIIPNEGIEFDKEVINVADVRIEVEDTSSERIPNVNNDSNNDNVDTPLVSKDCISDSELEELTVDIKSTEQIDATVIQHDKDMPNHSNIGNISRKDLQMPENLPNEQSNSHIKLDNIENPNYEDINESSVIDQVESPKAKIVSATQFSTEMNKSMHQSPSSDILYSDSFIRNEILSQAREISEINDALSGAIVNLDDTSNIEHDSVDDNVLREMREELLETLPVSEPKVNLSEAEKSYTVTMNDLTVDIDIIKDSDNFKSESLVSSPKENVLYVSTSNEGLLESEPILEMRQSDHTSELPDLVQISDMNTHESHETEIESHDTPVTVQNVSEEIVDSQEISDEATVEFKTFSEVVPSEASTDSTAYMDLTNSAHDDILKENTEIPTQYLEISNNEACASKNDSTAYLDLPSVIREMDAFLHSEKILSSREVNFKDNVYASTPVGSNSSVENIIDDCEENESLADTMVPDYGPGVTFTKLEQKSVPDSLSPFESPTKSHHTDTYDENSSVVLGSFENCTLDLYKGIKSSIEPIDLPKEELLAFSSNFSEINLATPSPLRDSNFLNEVPDLVSDDIHYNEPSTSDAKPIYDTDNNTDETSTTEKRISPSTPPNSPGNFLASTSQPTYLVDIDITNEPQNVDIDDVELQMAKLAMAENENNMNIEYSGPLGEDNLDESSRTNDVLPESFLAGNGGPVQGELENVAIDEERMKELRNELELKLPLAQVAGIEPAAAWTELPPPPELLVTYGALSPIAEETKNQLTAYENDDNWNTSTRTESSESYPEPAHNSSDEASDLPSAPPHSTYTLHSAPSAPSPPSARTYTLHHDLPTMSADSLNASPLKKVIEPVLSPIDDRTYNKNDEKESNCERLSQVSPFLLSPTTDTSAPDNSDLNAALSTLSKNTVPTNAKSSKPSETQCLSKATSIDSWCSNDTLYNVEENFDDLAMDPDLPLDFTQEQGDKSESEDTLTHNEEDKELSHCSTYIVHDSKSEACETFSPDSITANDNYTYTKIKTGTTPSVNTDLNDSTKNTQTKDLAYGTLGSGMPSYSNCTTELASGFEDTWKLPQPELVRRSPIADDINFTPPQQLDDKSIEYDSPQINLEPILKKMDSVEITCLDERPDHSVVIEHPQVIIENTDSPNINFKNMTHTVTSTPVTEMDNDMDKVEAIPCQLPVKDESEISANSLTNFQSFLHSVEIRPQDISSNNSNEAGTSSDLFENDSKMLSKNSQHDSMAISKKTMSYSDFENSAVAKPQDINSKSSQSMESGVGSEDFLNFETSVRDRPQDLSSFIDASSLLLKSERQSSEITFNNLSNRTNEPEPSTSKINPEQSIIINPTFESFRESPVSDHHRPNIFITDLDLDETEQPHSIIVTESPLLAKMSPNMTFDSHTEDSKVDYDSHTNHEIENDSSKNESKFNGSNDIDQLPSASEVEENKSKDAEQNESVESKLSDKVNGIKYNGGNEVFATVNFLNETFEELVESNVDDHESSNGLGKEQQDIGHEVSSLNSSDTKSPVQVDSETVSEVNGDSESKMTTATEDFLQNEKKFCQFDAYLPLLSDIRFTGPGSEIMTTSFSQDSPTEPTSPECERDSTDKLDKASELLKEWDSDTDSHSTNSSSGEFIWKDGEGRETLVPASCDHQRDSSQPSRVDEGTGSNSHEGSSGGDSGSEGDEVEFVPSSWDCRAAPSKSSLRSLEQPAEGKKRVVFKRQKYHCVYEYPREPEPLSPRCLNALPALPCLPDLSTYCEWDGSAVDAEAGYGQLFGSTPMLALGPDYDDDFFISSSARPFELGVMSTTSQFFPGMNLKHPLVNHLDDYPPPTPPTPLPHTTFPITHSLDFTTPDSGVEDITPGSTIDEDFKKIPEDWKPDSASSSESVSPSSPGGEALGGLRHTRDKLKLDLPPSPHLPSPRHNRVFNFVLDKPKRPNEAQTPLVMSDETPVIAMALPMSKDREDLMPEPTFSTFGKPTCKATPEKNIVLEEGEKEEKGETVKGEGTVLDSGDEDSGIESSSKATLERKPADIS